MRRALGLRVASGIIAGLLLGLAPAAFAAAPTITRFTPNHGPLGTHVVMTGAGFTGATAVRVAGTDADFTVDSDTQVQFTVPAASGSGKVTVTTGGGTVTSATRFTVEPGVALSPDVAHPTQPVNVVGSGFQTFEAVDVYLDANAIALASASGIGTLSARLTVPAGALPGPHTVTLIGRTSGFSAQRALDVHTDWPMRGGNPRHTGVLQHENVLTAGTVAGLDQDWRFRSGNSISSSPAVVGGIVYVGSNDGNVYALDAATGKQRWAFPTSNVVASSPAVVNGVVYVGSNDGKLYALDAATGTQRWAFATTGPVQSSPVVADGMVYVGSGSTDGRVYALNADTGVQLWKFATGGPVVGSPAVDGDVIYVGSSNHKLFGINAATGAQASVRTLGATITSSPTFANGVVYVSCTDGKLYAFNGATQKWTFTAGGIIEASPTVSGTTVFIGDEVGNMYAINTASGAQRWTVSLGLSISSTTAIAGSVVYVTADEHVDALSAASGALLWQADTGSSGLQGVIASSPAVADGGVYVGSLDHSLYAYHLD